MHVEAYSIMFTVAAPPAERTWFVSLLSSCTSPARTEVSMSMHNCKQRSQRNTTKSAVVAQATQKGNQLAFSEHSEISSAMPLIASDLGGEKEVSSQHDVARGPSRASRTLYALHSTLAPCHCVSQAGGAIPGRRPK